MSSYFLFTFTIHFSSVVKERKICYDERTEIMMQPALRERAVERHGVCYDKGQGSCLT